MKTPMLMQRELFGSVIQQNHKTGMFNLNDLERAASALRESQGKSKRTLANYFAKDNVDELIQEIALIEGLSTDEVKVSKRGREGGTWAHPILFVDAAMWFSPEVKARVLKWVVDGLLMARDDSGNSFKDMNAALLEHYPDFFDKPVRYAKIAAHIASVCKVGTQDGKWEHATQDQLELRAKIQGNIVILAGLLPTVQDCINHGVHKALGIKKVEVLK